MYITYGKRISGIHDEYVTGAQFALEGLNLSMIPGMFWIEYLPFFQGLPSWMPGMGWKKVVEKYSPAVLDMRDKPYLEAKADMVSSLRPHHNYVCYCIWFWRRALNVPPSIAASLIGEIRTKYGGSEEENMYDEIARNVTAVAYGGGLLFALLYLYLTSY